MEVAEAETEEKRRDVGPRKLNLQGKAKQLNYYSRAVTSINNDKNNLLMIETCVSGFDNRETCDAEIVLEYPDSNLSLENNDERSAKRRKHDESTESILVNRFELTRARASRYKPDSSSNRI